jgi:hypothetical protein
MRHSFDVHVRVPSLSVFSSKAIYGRVIEIEERMMDGERRGELALRQVWPRE